MAKISTKEAIKHCLAGTSLLTLGPGCPSEYPFWGGKMNTQDVIVFLALHGWNYKKTLNMWHISENLYLATDENDNPLVIMNKTLAESFRKESYCNFLPGIPMGNGVAMIPFYNQKGVSKNTNSKTK